MTNSVGIDWLRFSLPNSAFPEFLDFFKLDINELKFSERNGRSYRKYSCYFVDGGIVSTDSLPDERGAIYSISKRFILELSGSGLGNIALSIGHTPFDIVRYFVFFDDFRCNRIDIAFDDYKNLITPQKVSSKFILGDCSTRWKKGSYITSFEKGLGSGNGKGKQLGDTCYLGTRASSSFLRVYDKLAQLDSTDKQVPKGVKSWVRCELELKQDRATQLCKELSLLDDGSMSSSYLCSYLRGQIDFKTEDGSSRVTRRSSVYWWSEFLNDCAAYRMRIPKPARSIDDVDNWVKNSVAPSLALLLETKGASHILRIVKDGGDRLTAKHLSMLHGS